MGNRSGRIFITIGKLARKFVLGFVTQLLTERNADPHRKLFIGTGLLGFFTTFSTFALETFSFLQNSKLVLGLIYPLASLAIGVGAAALGVVVASLVPGTGSSGS